MTEEQEDILSLYGVPGIGAKTFARLAARFGSAGTVFGSSKKELMQMEGIGPVLAGNILSHDRRSYIRNQKRLMEKAGASILTRLCKDYPPLLNAFPSAPPVLFIRGDVQVLKKDTIAFVGTRKPSPYGIKMAKKLVEGVVDSGFCVISGMAEGIDSAAHRTAIDHGGYTVAVFGCGVDIIFPVFNRGLSEKITKSGCLLSHFPMGTRCSPGNFPARNSVIVGLSQATVVVEAPKKSGALITAELTLKAGRTLFAVPGNADVETCKGTNNLFTKGAQPVSNTNDILALLGKPAPKPPKKTKRSPVLPGLAGDILKTLDKEPLHIESICRIIGKSVSEILSELTRLEIEGHITQNPGKIFEKN
ncbi:MAG: DNA-protecting protein DprA [Candidatus Latescibacteria bacterium]|jgi:DNA processing protein|nr:DNA-protecting protein DprA [Candidatus Latescibacterota bacterium]